MSAIHPPALATMFAESLVYDRDLRDAALGDLAEDFAVKCESNGASAARAWYWSQVMRSVLPLSMMSLRRAGFTGWLRLIATVAVGYIVLAVLVVISGNLFMGVATNAISLYSLISLALGAGSAIIAGYLTARLGGKTPMLAALSLGVLCISISMLMFVYADGTDGSPLWYRIALALIVLPSTVCGAMLRSRQVK